MAKKTSQHFDVVVAGGGMAGMTLGIGLSLCGVKTAVIDAARPETQMAKTFDGRASAIAYAPYRMFEAIGIWKHIAKQAQPINEIHVADQGSFFFVHFEPADFDNNIMGYMLENRHIRTGLAKRRAEIKGLTFLAPDKIANHDINEAAVSITLESGRRLEAPLVIAAEGRRSPLREAAGIQVTGWSYGQSGVVATIQHEHPHLGIAHERFFPDGPFAILPLTGNRLSLVWALKTEMAEVAMNLSEEAFEQEVIKKVGGFLGQVKVTGPRWVFPLTLQMPERITAKRLALVGDAAHGIHPIAGQGLNLGLRDVAAIIEVLAGAKANGEDLGSEAVLERYAQWRRTDNLTLIAVTDALTRLFSNDIKPVKMARNIGLGIVNKAPAAKKFFVSHARGTFGKLPALLKGELPLH